MIGCGTSWFMAAAYAALREQLGAGETDTFAASQFPAERTYDRVVAISRSGTTTEVIRAIGGDALPGRRDHGGAGQPAGCGDLGRDRLGLRRRAVRGADRVRHDGADAAARLAG